MSERKSNPKITAFFERLERLDTGERARLKRNAGRSLAEARHTALGLFYRLLPPGVPVAQEETYFLVATLYPLVEGGGTGNLGAALRKVRQTQNAKGLDRRFEILLDADQPQLRFRLRQAIRLLGTNQIRIDWPHLLADLLHWTHPKRFVQRHWAQSYFSFND